MDRLPQPPLPWPGTPVPTACGGMIQYAPNTPCIQLKGELVYFCLTACLKAYDADPKTSCLAGDPRLES